jgi:2-hydroxychromene-2-carboxylate isomerase
MSDTKDPVEFWFDFSSPYSYIASERIDELVAKHGRKVKWRPIMLGAAFKASGLPFLVNVPLKGEYSKRDFDRSARYLGVPYTFPPKFPVTTLAAARGYYWLHGQDCGKAREFAHAVFRAYWVDGRDIGELPVVLEIADAGHRRRRLHGRHRHAGDQGTAEAGNRRRDRQRHVRRTLFHGGRRALLGRRPPAANRQVARHGRILVSVIKSKLNTRSEEYKANARR